MDGETAADGTEDRQEVSKRRITTVGRGSGRFADRLQRPKVLGASVKMRLRQLVQQIVQHVQKAHCRTLSGRILRFSDR